MHTYCLQISPSWNTFDSELIKHISTSRLEKASKYIHPIDQKLCIYAELVTRMGINQITGLPTNELVFSTKNNCKPQLLSSPYCHFNFSHTRNFIISCISLSGSVGADVEKIQSAPLYLLDDICHPEEIQYILNGSFEQQNLRFYQIWTQKEAYTKQLGIGLVENLPAINTLCPSISSLLYTWSQNDYMCCICCELYTQSQIIKLCEKDIYYFFANTY